MSAGITLCTCTWASKLYIHCNSTNHPPYWLSTDWCLGNWLCVQWYTFVIWIVIYSTWLGAVSHLATVIHKFLYMDYICIPIQCWKCLRDFTAWWAQATTQCRLNNNHTLFHKLWSTILSHHNCNNIHASLTNTKGDLFAHCASHSLDGASQACVSSLSALINREYVTCLAHWLYNCESWLLWHQIYFIIYLTKLRAIEWPPGPPHNNVHAILYMIVYNMAWETI